MTQDQPTDRPTERVRDGRGRYRRSLTTAQRDARAAEMAALGYSYSKIAAELGIAKTTAHDAVRKAMQETVAVPGAEARAASIRRYEAMRDAVLEVLEREHITVSQGKIIFERVLDEDGRPEILDYNPDGQPIYLEHPLLDDAPVLQAVDRLIKIEQALARLEGWEADTKINLTGGVRYEIVGIDQEKL